ncbi:ferritin-like domain-containing protein [Deinococcus sp.]|uniref:ferritin-like domain-containing protein n=1 Tax=Deinococcus sp. TaxID=47478 RepID=UPI0025E429E2|nr:ferritin-like domain-containing protein [Deinococcus sp.]
MSDSIKVPNRRQFLSAAGLMGAGAVLASCAPAMAEPTKPNIDADVLNFALNLEYLEAAFYLAAVGRLDDLRALGGGNAEIQLLPGTDGKSMMNFGDDDLGKATKAYAMEIAEDEYQHVKFLRGALTAAGVTPADRPVLNVGSAFGAAAKAATGADAALAFNPYANALFFLHGAFIFEDVGVTAYKGAARLITNPDYLEAAAGILAVEAYHAGEVRTVLYSQRAVVTPFGLTVAALIGKISALRFSVGGGKDQGITSDNTPTGASNIVPTDASSIAFSRSTDEVLNIVYLGSKAKPGGFFPNGLNGAIK